MTVITFKRNFSRMDSVWKLITQSSSRSSLYYLRSWYTSHSSLRYDAPLETRRPLFNCHSVQRHSVTAVSLNRYNIINATQDNSSNARNQQTNATIIGAYLLGTIHVPRRPFCHHHCFANLMGLRYLLSSTTPSTVFGIFCMKLPSLLAEHTSLTESGGKIWIRFQQVQKQMTILSYSSCFGLIRRGSFVVNINQ